MTAVSAWVVAGVVTTEVQAAEGATVAPSAGWGAGLLAGTHSRGLTRLAAPQLGADADTAQIPVEVDGEALAPEAPVPCTVRPAALRVRVPRDRPEVPDPKPNMDWKRLWRIALTVRRQVRSRPW